MFILFQLMPLGAVATENDALSPALDVMANKSNSLSSTTGGVEAENEALSPTLAAPQDPECKSAILMDADSGKILYAKSENEAYPPASVTKIMTLLLVMEEIEAGRLKLDDKIVASEHACSMGGSQIYLKVGETMSAEDMIKSVVIASANDAAVALAEHTYGSEAAFVQRMNERARELGMKNTNFENTNGLDDTAENHKTSALDIAIMSRELIRHKEILNYSSIWMDSIRNGEFGLTNTNKLVRYYKGCTGLKTGSTSKAGFCVSVTASRESVNLICVIMGAESGETRNKAASALLDYGFASFCNYTYTEGNFEGIKISGGNVANISARHGEFSICIEKSMKDKVVSEIKINESISAPVKRGDVIGKVVFSIDGKEIGSVDICSETDAPRIKFGEIFRGIFFHGVMI